MRTRVADPWFRPLKESQDHRSLEKYLFGSIFKSNKSSTMFVRVISIDRSIYSKQQIAC